MTGKTYHSKVFKLQCQCMLGSDKDLLVPTILWFEMPAVVCRCGSEVQSCL